VAEKAKQAGSGARGLRSVLEGILLNPMYDLPGLQNARKLVISPEVVRGEAPPKIVKARKKKESGKAG
jgi:ATP-dependent Clp protease ATP-binding subunit ClpX